MTTLLRIQRKVLAAFDDWSTDFRAPLREKLGEAATGDVLEDARARLQGMCASIPDPGVMAPHMREFTISGAVYVALHLALKQRGHDAAWTWGICEQATRAHFQRMGPMQKKLAAEGMFGLPMKLLSRWIARRSRKEPVGGWVFDYVEPADGFAYGVDYRRCAIRELAVQHGAADLAPYICLADVPGSEMFGWGLVRTETLAQGGTRCDFRFRRGGPTQVKSRLPVVE